MVDKADVVVIGGGAYGASVTYHLVRAGIRQVVLIDKSEPVSQTSPRAAGLSSQVQPTRLLTRIAAQSVRDIEHFKEETGESFSYQRPGSLKIACTARHAERLEQEVDRARRWGVDVELVDAQRIGALSRWIETASIVRASYTPADLYFEPETLPQASLRAARRGGATVISRTPVTQIKLQGGRVFAVVTDRGVIQTPVVVDAAGAWSALVGNLVSVRIPVVPIRHQLLITQPAEGIEPDHPIVRVMDTNVYVRPCQGGWMLGGYERQPRLFKPDELTLETDIRQLELDIDVLTELAGKTAVLMPVLQNLKVREHRGGLPTMTIDGNPVVGPLPGLEGFYVISGCCVGGLAKSPALGRALAETILGSEAAEDLQDAAPDRFADLVRDPQKLLEACRWQYANHYDRKKAV